MLAALEADTDFNVNVLTGNDGVLRGASGGHQDAAAGAALSIVVCPSFRGGVPSIKNKVTTITTPGETVDVIVTERGICVNPQRADVLEAALKAKLPVIDIEKLKGKVEKLTGVPEPIEFDYDRLIAAVEYRDGTASTRRSKRCAYAKYNGQTGAPFRPFAREGAFRFSARRNLYAFFTES